MGVLFAVFGTVFALFAIVALFVGAHLGWIYGHVLLALACFAYALGTSFGALRELLAGDAARRSARFGGNAALQVVALAVILGVLAYLSKQYPVIWDWTEAKVHSLSEASLDVLERIPEDRPVEILAFYLPGTEQAASDAREAARGTLDLYTYASPRVRVRIVDPAAHPELATRFQVTTNGVLIVCGGPCDSAAGTARVTEPSEQEVTRAIRSVLSGKKKVYYLTGHGEADPRSSEATGASAAKSALEGENLEVAPLVLANQEEVPSDAAAVIVAGPDRTLFGRELEALDRYLRGGGSLLVMSDPIVVSGLEETVRSWGIELGKDVIVDQRIQLFAGPQLGVEPVVLSYGAHPVTEKMRDAFTSFYLARSLQTVDTSAGIVELASTGEASWAETALQTFIDRGVVGIDDGDRRGPLAIAAARTFEPAGEGEKKREGRLVVVGDSDFARNRYLASGANADLLLNMANWLVGEEHFITIERKLPRASSVALTNEQFYDFRYLALFVMPEALLLFGILVWWRRRN